MRETFSAWPLHQGSSSASQVSISHIGEGIFQPGRGFLFHSRKPRRLTENETQTLEMTMKTILSTLVALSVLAGAAATSAQAATFRSQEYWVEHDRNMN